MWLAGIAICVFVVVSLIMPWVLLGRIGRLERELQGWRSYVLGQGVVPAIQATPPVPPLPVHTPAPIPATPVMPAAPAVASLAAPREKVSFEQRFGAHLPVWVGGIALVLAGFFLVKYSIETGLLTPTVRVLLGGVFGGGLIAAAQWVSARPAISNGRRIAQALAGAGIAVLYLVLFAATTLYGMVHELVGFLGMATVTAGAVGLALRHGPAIAVLGLAGGMLTPVLIHSEAPNAALFFLYLFVLFAGIVELSRRQGWLWLVVPTILGSLLWGLTWMLLGASDSELLSLCLFLLGSTAYMAVRLAHLLESPPASAARLPWGKLVVWGCFGGATLLLMGAVSREGFPWIGWGTLFVLSAGSLVLAHRQPRIYAQVPIMTCIAALMLVLTCRLPSWTDQALLVLAFGTLYTLGGYALSVRSATPLLWVRLAAASSVAFFLVGYATLSGMLARWIASGTADPVMTERVGASPLAGMPIWGLLALALAFLFSQWTRQLLRRDDAKVGQGAPMLAATVLAGFAFIAIGLTIELTREFLSVAVAMVMLGAAWLGTRLPLPTVRLVVALLGIGFAVLLLPQILLLVQITAYSLVEAKLMLQEGIPLVNWPLFQLGVPAALFLASAVLLRRVRDGRLVQALEVGAIALIGVMGYYLTRHAFHAASDVLFVKAGFFERGVITNVLFSFGIGCAWLGQYYARSAVRLAGLVLVGVGLFRVLFFDLIISNPLWADHRVGELLLFNTLALPLGLPLLWLQLVQQPLRGHGLQRLQPWARAGQLGLLFLWVSLNVTQLFHGSDLRAGSSSNGEFYAYSVAWLILSLALLFVGTLKQQKMLRVASLILMIVTVAKVFLLDASELTGLLRVFSFLGLGISLIGIGWFYSRFVFGSSKQTTEA